MLKQLKNQEKKTEEIVDTLVNSVHKQLAANSAEDRALLKRFGLDKALTHQEEVKGDWIIKKDLESKYNFPVFTIGEILHICYNYNLKFLRAEEFSLPIPADTLQKIKTLPNYENYDKDDIFIAAPPSSFDSVTVEKLKLFPEIQLDPALFVRSSQDRSKYFLIKEWGKDLSLYRRLRSIPYQNTFIEKFESASFRIYFSLILTVVGAILTRVKFSEGALIGEKILVYTLVSVLFLFAAIVSYFILGYLLYNTFDIDKYDRNSINPTSKTTTARTNW